LNAPSWDAGSGKKPSSVFGITRPGRVAEVTDTIERVALQPVNAICPSGIGRLARQQRQA
jgi:hypothetical protein